MNTNYLDRAKGVLESIPASAISVPDRLRLAEVLLEMHRLESKTARAGRYAQPQTNKATVMEGVTRQVESFLPTFFSGSLSTGLLTAEYEQVYNAYRLWAANEKLPTATAAVFGKALRSHPAFLGKRRPRGAGTKRHRVLSFDGGLLTR